MDVAVLFSGGKDSTMAVYAALLQPGDTFEKLPETWVIFITENDVLKGGQPLYTIETADHGNGYAVQRRGAHYLCERSCPKRHNGVGKADA